MYFRNETLYREDEIVMLWNVIEHDIMREKEFIQQMSEPPEYEDEDYSESIASAKKRIEELKALQDKLLTD